MATVAQQMGATTKLDLTSDVTHLIVGNIDTAKYKYVAKERRDIKVLSIDWLEAVRASWLEGGVTDVEALERQYAYQLLLGFTFVLLDLKIVRKLGQHGEFCKT